MVTKYFVIFGSFVNRFADLFSTADDSRQFVGSDESSAVDYFG
jgi:hypothetical protein